MAKQIEKKKLEKKNWAASFELAGKASIGQHTYKIDEKSEKSDWIYNVLNIGVDCGEKHGTVYAELMGGYGSERDNIIYVHGKKDDGRDDFDNKYTIDWDDRFDEGILEEIGEMCFITIGIEKDKHDKIFYNKFLSAYDAIAYVKENLEDGTTIKVKGNIKYQSYNGNVNLKKEITSIILAKDDDKFKPHATFVQTVLLDKDSLGKIDKSKGIMPITGTVLEYTKEWKGKEVKQFIPLKKIFEYELDLTSEEKTKKIIDKLLKVRKGVTEITFEGDFIEGGAVVTVTEDDIPEDIKELIEIGAYTLEEALAKCTEGTSKERRMVFRKPSIKMQGEEGNKTPVIQKFDQKYDENDLILDFMYESEEDEVPFEEDKKSTKKSKDVVEEPEEETDDSSESEDDWLSRL